MSTLQAVIGNIEPFDASNTSGSHLANLSMRSYAADTWYHGIFPQPRYICAKWSEPSLSHVTPELWRDIIDNFTTCIVYPFQDQVKLEIQYTCWTVPRMAIPTIALFFLEVRGYSNLYDDISSTKLGKIISFDCGPKHKFHGLSTNHFLFNDGSIYMQDFTAILLSDTKIASIAYLKPCTNRELRISDRREVIISLHVFFYY